MNKLIWAALGTAVGVAATAVVFNRYRQQIGDMVIDLQDKADELLSRFDPADASMEEVDMDGYQAQR